jgi:hypothetical protein
VPQRRRASVAPTPVKRRGKRSDRHLQDQRDPVVRVPVHELAL